MTSTIRKFVRRQLTATLSLFSSYVFRFRPYARPPATIDRRDFTAQVLDPVDFGFTFSGTSSFAFAIADPTSFDSGNDRVTFTLIEDRVVYQDRS